MELGGFCMYEPLSWEVKILPNLFGSLYFDKRPGHDLAGEATSHGSLPIGDLLYNGQINLN